MWRSSAALPRVTTATQTPRSSSTSKGKSRLSQFAMVALCVVSSQVRLANGQGESTVLLSGKVIDVNGMPVAGAEVTVHEPTTKIVSERTDRTGFFLLRTAQQPRYEVTATTSDHRRGESVLVQPGTTLQIVVKAPASDHTEIQFADKPDFTVAGITDWTAVGGHGSDATLRTSEELARQAAALQTVPPGTNLRGGPEETARESALRETLAAQPNDYAANRALGRLYLQSGRFRDASGLLENAAKLGPDTASDEYAAALACKGEGDYSRARLHITRALERDSSVADYHRVAGDLNEKLGDPLAAVREEQKATLLNPSEENYFAWASELLLHRAIWQAAEVFSQGAGLHPKSPRLKAGWGAALFAGAEYAPAAQHLCEASDLDPSNRESYLLLGKIGLGSPSVPTCVRDKLDQFLQSHPSDPEANYCAAMMLLKAAPQDRARATELLRKAVALQPHFAEGYLQLGILSLTQHEDAAAQNNLELAVAADPSLAEAHYRLGVLYDRTGHHELAKAEFLRHEMLVKRQADAVEQERRQVKQFLVVLDDSASRNVPSQ